MSVKVPQTTQIDQLVLDDNQEIINIPNNCPFVMTVHRTGELKATQRASDVGSIITSLCYKHLRNFAHVVLFCGLTLFLRIWLTYEYEYGQRSHAASANWYRIFFLKPYQCTYVLLDQSYIFFCIINIFRKVIWFTHSNKLSTTMGNISINGNFLV